ncbi:NADP-dependent oxidoreductase [Hyphodiscus hymeniophilus]|uniref:NADP-dependent oxidoreductase n=1 Tax=Hyphodiscus hymeniophilus TaxID=353542 RepID=A0A9P6VNK8_9HELO|nr:NADP-dependent oxidoreductase [Hyphodiscus hymeniophilus]
MGARQNLTIQLAERPRGDIIPGQTFRQVRLTAPTVNSLSEGQVLVEVLYLSLDPAMRSWINDVRSYLPPVAIGETMRGTVIARVLESRSHSAVAGDLITSFNAGWTELAVLSDGQFDVVSSSSMPANGKLTDLMGVLGITGLTAWIGLKHIGQPKPGETVVVSGAAGATGSVVGQLAKIRGARVVGIAGSDEKVRWLTEELKFDVGLNYKSSDFREKFENATPDYINVFWDNVGGEQLDVALGRAAKNSRFVMCGGISQYNAALHEGPRNITNVVYQRVRMQGFVVFDHIEDYPAARAELAHWLGEGKIKRKETIIKGGLRVAEQTLVGLFRGTNTGKLLLEQKSPSDPGTT